MNNEDPSICNCLIPCKCPVCNICGKRIKYPLLHRIYCKNSTVLEEPLPTKLPFQCHEFLEEDPKSYRDMGSGLQG
jgi:hypothetical protein